MPEQATCICIIKSKAQVTISSFLISSFKHSSFEEKVEEPSYADEHLDKYLVLFIKTFDNNTYQEYQGLKVFNHRLDWIKNFFY